jgi:hypothetical protein
MKVLNFKNATILGSAFLAILGCFNTFQMNSNQFMNSNEIKFAKRLDEMNGDVKVGRLAASAINWETLKQNKNEIVAMKAPTRVIAKPSINEEAPLEVSTASIKEDLTLNVTQVFNSKDKNFNANKGEASGSITTKDGVIESINVTLPSGQAIEISTNSEMEGNVFQYEDNDTKEIYSGMFYKISETSYMVTLTNDKKLGGTRIQFDAPTNGEEENANSNWAMNDGSYESAIQEETTSQEVSNNEVAPQVESNQEVANEEISNENANQVDQAAQEQALNNNEQNVEQSNEGYGFDFSA